MDIFGLCVDVGFGEEETHDREQLLVTGGPQAGSGFAEKARGRERERPRLAAEDLRRRAIFSFDLVKAPRSMSPKRVAAVARVQRAALSWSLNNTPRDIAVRQVAAAGAVRR